ncbi:MAG: hypothetical protein GC137_06755 [Alphaproteobacteria bacterium]|nr:hypothetical protein [Alphaproteobacteria bacterium]
MKNLSYATLCLLIFSLNPAHAFEDKQKECRDFDYSCLQKNRAYDFETETHKEDKIKFNKPKGAPEPIDPWKKDRKSSLGEIQSDMLKSRND